MMSQFGGEVFGIPFLKKEDEGGNNIYMEF